MIKMKHCFLLAILLFGAMALSLSAQTAIQQQSECSQLHVIPIPAQVRVTEGSFNLNEQTIVSFNSEELLPLARFISQKLSIPTGFSFPVEQRLHHENAIQLTLDKQLHLPNKEGYRLTVSKNGVLLAAATPQGLFYAFQTMMQLLPPQIESASLLKSQKWFLPAVNIEDYPQFSYRGLLIDVCRHFFTIDELKKQIDVLALFKINTLHLHLTDDQAWRIEIKKYPRLTQIGAYRTEEKGQRYGGFYTQQQLKELVKYAAERFITIIPEIEMPGHALAALSAYPQFACFPKKFTPRTIWGVEDDVYCAGNDDVFHFCDDVLREVAEIFPSPYIHIGGDECPKTRWNKCPKCLQRIDSLHLKDAHELQSYFIHRVEGILAKYNKKLIGWDEILEGGLAPSATVMSWRGESGGIKAANMGHDVIMTPSSDALYIDHYQGSPFVEPLAIGGFAPLEKTYSYNPLPKQINPQNAKHILGAQCNMWTEYVYNNDLLEYRIYPRILALAELTWSQPSQKNFQCFCMRLNDALLRLDEHRINYHIPLPEQPKKAANYIEFQGTDTLTLTSSRPITILYTCDGSTPNASSAVYKKTIVISESCQVKVASMLPSGKLSKVRTITYKKVPFAAATQVINPQPGLRSKLAFARVWSVREIPEIKFWLNQYIYRLADIVATSIRNSNAYENPYVTVTEGYINIQKTGNYLFYSDNTQVWIDNKCIINNDGMPKKSTHSRVIIALEKGLHPFKVISVGEIKGGWPSYWNDGNVYMRAEGQEKAIPISSDMLFHKP